MSREGMPPRARSARPANTGPKDPVTARTMERARSRNASRASNASASSSRTTPEPRRRKVSSKEGKRMYDAFRYLDKDNSNKLTYTEFEEALVGLGYNPKACRKLFDMVDTNKDGNLEYREFVRALCVEGADKPTVGAKAMDTALNRAQQAWHESGPTTLSTNNDDEDSKPKMSEEEMLGRGMSQKRVADVMEDRKKKADASEAFMLSLAKEKIKMRTLGTGNAKYLSNDNLFKAFAFFDENEDGGINKQELEEALQMLGVSVSEKCLDDLFEQFDEDKNGVLDYEEFAHLALGSSGRRSAIYHR